MQKISPKIDKKALVFFTLCALLLIELAVIIPWLAKRAGSFAREAENISRRLKEVKNDWPRYDDYLNSSKVLKEGVGSFRETLILPAGESRFLAFISDKARDFEVEVQSLLPQAEIAHPDSDDFFYFPVSLRARAGYHDLGRFFSFLQSGGYFIDIRQFRIIHEAQHSIIEVTLCGLMERERKEAPPPARQRRR